MSTTVTAVGAAGGRGRAWRGERGGTRPEDGGAEQRATADGSPGPRLLCTLRPL
ncbi:hypothetical protein [Streptomyces sp. SGAir0957]